MTVYVGLARAVNLGGETTVRMADLARVVEAAGGQAPRPWLRSGNVVFEAAPQPTDAIERRLEERGAAVLGRAPEFFVRSAATWATIVRGNPFPDAARSDPAHLTVMVLKEEPAPTAWRRLEDAIVGRERAVGRDRHAYLVYPDGIGRSRLTASVVERALGTRGTLRNWNTVTALARLAAAPERGHAPSSERSRRAATSAGP